MLRHYDKIGLLRPDSILPNGYRCYHEKQIGIISQIKRLRGCGFLLDEISEILQNNSSQFLAEEARRKLTQAQGQAVQQQTEIQALYQLIQESGTVETPFIYGVSLSKRQESILLTPQKMLVIDEVEDAFNDLFQMLYNKKLHTTNGAILLNQINSEDENQIRVGVPIIEPYNDDFYQILLLPSTPVLSVIHYGDYYKIGHAYSALLKFAQQYAYSIDDTVMERYFIDSSHNVSSNEYVTEISVALKNTP